MWANTLAQGKQFLTDKRVYILIVLALCAFTLAYQWHVAYVIAIGAPLDRPYVDNFRPPQGVGEAYRRTRKHSRIILFGQPSRVARRVSITTKRAEKSKGTFKLAINGLAVADLAAPREWQTQTVVISDPRLLGAYDWVLELEANNDIVVREVRAEPVGWVEGQWQALNGVRLDALVIPDLRRVGYLTLAVLIVYGLLVCIGVPRNYSFGVALAALIIFFVLMIAARMYLTVVTLQLVLLLLFCAGLIALAAFLSPRLFQWGGVTLTPPELRAVLLVFLIALLVKFGGAFYPQFHSSDGLYHQHRLERVMTGDLFFLTQAPEFAGRMIPLAPGYYIVLTPLTTIVADHGLVLQIASILFDTTTVFFLFYLAKKFMHDARVGWIAGIVYTFTPITFLMLSAGNLPNIFSQWILVTLIVVLLNHHERLRAPRVWLIALFLFVLAGVSHLGNLIVLTTLLVALAGLTLLTSRDFRALRGLALLIAAGITLSFLLYYSDFFELLAQEFQQVLAQKFGGGLQVAGTLNFKKVPLAISYAVIGGGIVGAFIGRQQVAPPFQRALWAWFASAGLFVLFAQFVGLYVRYNIFVLPALSLGVGLGCVWLMRRARWGFVVVALYLAYVIWVGASYWFQRVMFAYH